MTGSQADGTHRFGIPTLIGLLLPMLAAACGEAETDVGSVRVDTVGTTVVVESPPVEPEPATLIRRIGATDAGGAEAPDLFGRIRSVTLDDEGSIYVADRQAQEIRVFSSEGIHLRTFGRPGEGPGELGDLYSLGWLGDTLAAMDPGNARISLFAPDGAPVGQRRWLAMTGGSAFIRLFSLGGEELYAPFPSFDRENPERVFLRFQPGVLDPDTVRYLLPESEPDGLLCRLPGGGIRFFGNPYAERVVIVPGPEAHVAVADGGRPDVGIVTAAGDTTRLVSVRESPRPVPDEAWAEVEADLEEFRRDGPGAECEPQDLTRPEVLPRVDDLFFTREGTLVVERIHLGATRFDFFTSEGVLEQRVDLPKRDDGVAPAFVDRWIVTAERDELGVQTVALYER